MGGFNDAFAAKLSPDAFQKLYLDPYRLLVIWADRFPPEVFDMLCKWATVVFTEGNNAVMFNVANNIPTITPMARSITWPATRTGAMLTAATKAFGDSSGKITSAHQAIAKAIRQTKDARSGMVQLSNTFAKASYQFENDQVAQGLLKLSAKLKARSEAQRKAEA